MKAMILAAGFGSRLLPFTKNIPKPLFPFAGRPLLDMIIRSLEDANCQAIIINTHHLHEKIEAFIIKEKYKIPISIRYEPVILGTGGAIKNVADFWDNKAFMVINSDIVTNIDLKEVYDFHLSHQHPATLVLHDYPDFNNVLVNQDAFVIGFHYGHQPASIHKPMQERLKKDLCTRCKLNLAFTGIHVLNPSILDYIPNNSFSNIIDVYDKLISNGKKLKAFISKNHYWEDIGTPQRYKKAVIKKMGPEAFNEAFPNNECRSIKQTQLKGDGSDRDWFRLESGAQSIIMADHGLKNSNIKSEIDSFVTIGKHLHGKGLPVPQIYLYDKFSGLVFLEDLGDLNLQELINRTDNLQGITFHYESIIDLLVQLSVRGAEKFDPAWTYQTSSYNKDVILEKECRYFVESFLRGYLGMDVRFQDLKNEFSHIADMALKFSVNGFMHRDMQSRNIMIKNNHYYFIDFQGGRIGPIQYDLASLIIDPYVKLPLDIQVHLLNYCMVRLSTFVKFNPHHFKKCFKYCSIARNLQILGAFGYLSQVKEKKYFEKYIPAALKALKYNLSVFENTKFLNLKLIINKLI
ncbi:MAG: phosphotransferase [Desulfobacterales bacterium]|nr:phosphotransferase [Desulfobacterales bacterium]